MGNIKPLEAYFKSHDNHRLYYQAYKIPKSKSVLIFVHGLGEHIGRYQNPVSYFSKKNYSVYLFDQRGHGKSDGLRSFVDSFNEYLEDLDDFINFVASENKNQKIYLIGHSMGGQIVLNYLAQFKKNPLSGFMTSSANIKVALPLNQIKKKLGINLSKILPKLFIPSEIKPSWVATDTDVVEKYKTDPMVSKKISLALAREILTNQENILELAPKIKLPGFMMHAGDDKICNKEGTTEFYEKLGSKDKDLKIYEGFYHEIFNDIHRTEVFEDMEAWLKKH